MDILILISYICKNLSYVRSIKCQSFIYHTERHTDALREAAKKSSANGQAIKASLIKKLCLPNLSFLQPFLLLNPPVLLCLQEYILGESDVFANYLKEIRISIIPTG